MAATHQGTCPICHRTQKIVRDMMAKHGFRRPQGWHQEVGQCWGSYRGPWETPMGRAAAQEYVETVLQVHYANMVSQAQKIDAGEVEELVFQVPPRFGSHDGAFVTIVPSGSMTVQLTVHLRRGPQPEKSADELAKIAERWEADMRLELYPDSWRSLTTWQRACAKKAGAARKEAHAIKVEMDRMTGRIERWTPGELTTLAPEAKPRLPFTPTYPEVVVIREVRYGWRGQTRMEVWSKSKGWVKMPWAAIEPLFNASPRLARPMTPGEAKSGPTPDVFDPFVGAEGDQDAQG